MFIKSTQKKTIDYVFEDASQFSFYTELAALVNKFKSVFNIINTVLESEVELRQEYEVFLKEYIKSTTDQERYTVFLKYYQKLFNMIDAAYYKLDLGKHLKINVKDEYCLNINKDETEQIFKTSVRTRFFVICYMSEYAVDQISQKEIHKIICREMIDKGILEKLYRIINSIVLNTFPTKSGKKIWDLLSTSTGYTSDAYSIKLLSSIIYKALPALKSNENPVAFMVSIAKNEMDWLLRTKLGIKIVNSDINIVTITEPNNRIEEYEIYYRTIVKQYFEPINEKYPLLSSKLSKYNTYPVVSTVCAPLINKIFGVGINHILLDNISLVNLFCYDFLSKYDLTKPELIKILTLAPYNNNYERVLPESLKTHIHNICVNRNLNKLTPQLTPVNLKKVINEAILKIYSYSYLNILTNEEVEINWINFIIEYIDYLVQILSGGYNTQIQETKQIIVNNRKEDVDVFTH